MTSRNMTGIAGRWIVTALAVVFVVRAGAFLAYAVEMTTTPSDAWYLEPKMAHLAWRFQTGATLYPEWREYPHVSNFFGPIYFVATGFLSWMADASLEQLPTIGRALTVVFGVATSVVVGREIGRRHGLVAGFVGAAASLGAAPMYGFGVMVRPDTMAQFLGVTGFFLANRVHAGARLASIALLAAALLTKQTEVFCLVAAVAAQLLAGRRAWAIGLAAGTAATFAIVVGALTVFWEPLLPESLVGEGSTPWRASNLASRVWELCRDAPELPFLVVVGLISWTARPARDRAMLAFSWVTVIASVVTSAKAGADLNYYLNLRVVEAFVVGELVSASRRAGLAWSWWLPVIAALALVLSVRSTQLTLYHARAASLLRIYFASPRGQLHLAELARMKRTMQDSSNRILTNFGRAQYWQRGRAAFVDPWLFKTQVESGLIVPRRMREWVEREQYDWILTTDDLFAPSHDSLGFGLPRYLAEPARAHYRLSARWLDMYLYEPIHRTD